LKEVKSLPENTVLRRDLIAAAEDWIAMKRLDESNAAINSCSGLAGRRSERPLSLIGPSKTDGGVSRIVERPDGSAKGESWKAGTGWVEGGASSEEFMPGTCTPVTPELAKRFGIPDSELEPG
jgi:hypothetical protein